MRNLLTPPARLLPITSIFKQPARAVPLLQDIWLIEKLAHFDREVIPERRMHAKGWGAYGTFAVTGDITRYMNAKIFSEVARRRRCLHASRPLPASVAPPMLSETSAEPR